MIVSHDSLSGLIYLDKAKVRIYNEKFLKPMEATERNIK